MKKHALLPLLCALLCFACAAGCNSSQESGQSQSNELVSATPDGPAESKNTRAASTTAPATAKTTKPTAATSKSKAKVNSVTPNKRAGNTANPTAPTVNSGNIPPNDISNANLNPNMAEIANRVSGDINSHQVTGISLSKTDIELEVGEKADINITYQPADAMYKLCTVKGSNSCVQISSTNTKVTVKGKSAGTCVITVTSQNGHRATCSVTVKRNETITDDSKIAYEDLYTAEKVGRLTAELSDMCSSLGMTNNASLKGNADIVINTADNKGKKLSFNEVKADYLQKAKSNLAGLVPDGDYKNYVYNCYSESNGSSYVINIVISHKEN